MDAIKQGQSFHVRPQLLEDGDRRRSLDINIRMYIDVAVEDRGVGVVLSHSIGSIN